MRVGAKVAIGVGAAAAAWVGAVFVYGVAMRGRVGEQVRGRLAESLDARVRFAEFDLELVRGAFAIEGVAIERDHDGHLQAGVERIDAAIAPLGAYLWDRDLGPVEVEGVDLDVRGFGVLRIVPPPRPPVRMAHLAIDDAQLRFAAANTSWQRFQVTIDHADAGRTVLRTPLSWVFALEHLDATLELPGVAPITLHYGNGRLDASGGLFGDAPVSIPVSLPMPVPGHEGQQLLSLGEDVAERLALARASGWIDDVLR